jgi:hypothetical protein
MWLAASHYLYGVLFISGAFACLYLGFRLVRARTKSAEAASSFSGKWGDKEFTIGAGSLAASSLAVSLFWVAAAVWTRPTLSYENTPNGESIRVSAVFDDPRFKKLEAAVGSISDTSEIREATMIEPPLAMEVPPLPDEFDPHEKELERLRVQLSALKSKVDALEKNASPSQSGWPRIACSNGTDGLPCKPPEAEMR